jgi:hypothetical protein
VVSPNQIETFATLSEYATQQFDLIGKEINTVPKVKMGASGAMRAAIHMDFMLIFAPFRRHFQSRSPFRAEAPTR